MKIAVLTDIHANLPALQRVTEDFERWGPDEVIMGGDLVTRGPYPRECLDFVREKQRQNGWRMVRGNHEDYVINQARPGAPRSGPAFEAHRATIWALQQIDNDVSDLEAMPFQQSWLDPAGKEARCVHASMLGNRDGIYPETTDDELGAKIGLGKGDPPAVLCVGHTHRPLIRRYLDTLVVNAGSVGLPFDGNRRASYARLTWKPNHWQAEIVRLDYDWSQTERAFVENGYLAGGGPLVELVLLEFYHARSQLFTWARRYQHRVQAGEITMEASVHAHLQHE